MPGPAGRPAIIPRQRPERKQVNADTDTDERQYNTDNDHRDQDEGHRQRNPEQDERECPGPFAHCFTEQIVADGSAEQPMAEKPAVQPQGAAQIAAGGQQQKGSGGQDRQEDADDAQRQGQCSGQYKKQADGQAGRPWCPAVQVMGHTIRKRRLRPPFSLIRQVFSLL